MKGEETALSGFVFSLTPETALPLVSKEPLCARAAQPPAEPATIFTNNEKPKQHQQIDPSMKANIEFVSGSPRDALKQLAAIIAKNRALHLDRSTSAEKALLASDASEFYRRELAGRVGDWDMMPLGALKAADVTDAQIGTLSGTLVLLRALPMMKMHFPLLSAIWQDFSTEPGLFQQTENTRIVLEPSVQSYNSTPDATGRPKGWDTVSPARTLDVPVPLDNYVGVPIVFSAATLASTMRRLFEEQAPAAMYALGKYLVGMLTAHMTAANFNAYAVNSLANGATTDGSAVVTVTSTAGCYGWQIITGTGIPTGTRILSVDSGTQLTLTKAATATNAALTFALQASQVPATYATYARALADMSLADLGTLRGVFSQNEVPQTDRHVLLNSHYYERLAEDPNFNTYFVAARSPETMTEGILPRLRGFTPHEAPYMPSSSNRVGFATHKSALVLKTRLPQDLTKAVAGDVPGSITTVTDNGLGISVALVEYVNLVGNYAEMRPELMAGSAVGDRRGGLVLTSQ